VKIRFRRVRPAPDSAAIARLNARLRAAGLEHVVGNEPADRAEPSLDAQPIIERMFVAADDDGEIRGAVWLKEQLFWTRSGIVRAGWMIYPVSESLADPRFAGVPGTLLFGLLREQPQLMALGMGGEAGSFAKLLAGARWKHTLVPLHFRVLRPARVLRELRVARRTPARRIAGHLLAASGLARIGYAAVAGLDRAIHRRSIAAADATPVDRFEGWVDAVWEAHRAEYAFCAVRDARLLDTLYPSDFAPITRLRVRRADADLGWVCAQAIDARGTWLEPHFGELRVGILTDAFASPADAVAVLDAGLRALCAEGVDLIVTNQLHTGWREAARALGFWVGPSTLAFSWSPRADPLLADRGAVHLTRSDGDGPQGSSS
jgi:hypothetical protein